MIGFRTHFQEVTTRRKNSKYCIVIVIIFYANFSGPFLGSDRRQETDGVYCTYCSIQGISTEVIMISMTFSPRNRDCWRSYKFLCFLEGWFVARTKITCHPRYCVLANFSSHHQCGTDLELLWYNRVSAERNLIVILLTSH